MHFGNKILNIKKIIYLGNRNGTIQFRSLIQVFILRKWNNILGTKAKSLSLYETGKTISTCLPSRRLRLSSSGSNGLRDSCHRYRLPHWSKEILLDGKCGILVSMKNERSMFQAIQQLMTNSKQYEEFQRLAFSRVIDFSKDSITQKLQQLFLKTEYCLLKKEANLSLLMRMEPFTFSPFLNSVQYFFITYFLYHLPTKI